MAIVGDVFGPAVAALTLGLYARAGSSRGGWAATPRSTMPATSRSPFGGRRRIRCSQRAVFLLVPVCAVLPRSAVLSIPRAAIDEARAREMASARRGRTGTRQGAVRPVASLLRLPAAPRLRRLRSALPLCQRAAAAAGRAEAARPPTWATPMMSACIIAAQLIMLPLALAVGRTADRLGRKPILLVAFAILPVRAVLYTVSDHMALADRRPAPRRGGRRHLRRDHPARWSPT